MQSVDDPGWELSYQAMEAAWADLRAESSAAKQAEWQEAFSRIASHHAALVSAGDWLSGPSDMMRLLQVNDLELMHSKVVGWLLTPTSRHRLGDHLLARILQAGWPDEPPMTTSRALVRLEVAQSQTRADIVAYMPEGTLVIENKVWATEGESQCESLFQEWIGSGDVRFLLLTREGHAPRTTQSEAAASAWRSLSYRGLGALLDDELRAYGGDVSPGTRIAEQYLATLRAMSLVGSRFEITVGGGHVDE